MKPSVFRQPSTPRYGMGRENDTCRSILEVLLREINERQASLPQVPDSPPIVSRSRSCPPCYRERAPPSAIIVFVVSLGALPCRPVLLLRF